MRKSLSALSAVCVALLLSGCDTTNSIPYQISTANIIGIQEALDGYEAEVAVGNVSMPRGIEKSLTCRLLGPIRVAPGKSLSQYIRDAFIGELFEARVYKADSDAVISAKVQELKFSSVTPASWDITMAVSSNLSQGYTVSVNYEFDTSFTAYSACQNVADAFGPAIQELLSQVVTHPGFVNLAVES